jgi:hypothetical protein
MEDDANSKLHKSPATMMAEASVLSQQVVLKEANNLKSMIEVQKEELVLRKHDFDLQREEQKMELSLMKAERESRPNFFLSWWKSSVQTWIQRICSHLENAWMKLGLHLVKSCIIFG